MKDYLKCVYANKYTFIGLIMSVIYFINMFYLEKTTATLIVCLCNTPGLLMFGFTGFGLETYKVYQKTKSHILNQKTIRDEYARINSINYCDRIGMNLAINELGYKLNS